MQKSEILMALVAALAVASPAFASLSFTDCSSTYEVKRVEMGTCKQVPCPVLVEQEVNVTTTFYAKFPSSELIPTALYYAINTKFPATVGSYDPRDAANGGDTTQRANITVNPELPPVLGYLQWMLHNEKGERVVCFRVDILIYWYWPPR
ncbi:hypothetical protein R5R35_007707 [Gryllus longicercus]|uniref:MD-2-related lipid-recognition domain-containing protein n=1 Tax=Gryllus longicercus TaxID=2509291 RepID=A0AAN9VFU1_9ORTH